MTNKNNYLLIGIIIVAVAIIAIVFILNSNNNFAKQNFYLTSENLCGDLENDPSAMACWRNYDYEDGKSGLCQEPCAEKCASLNFKLSSSKFDCWSYEEVNNEKSEEGWACTRSCRCTCV